MKQTALHFTYGNQSSMAFGVSKINFDSGVLQEEIILPERTLNTEMRKHTNIMDFYSINYDKPLEIEMEILLDDKWKEEGFLHRKYLVNVIRWLKRETYLPLIFDTMPDTIFYAIMSSDFVIYHNSRNQGYLKVRATCNSPYGFTMVQNSPIYTNTGLSNIQIIANSDFDTSLIKVLIKKHGDGNLLIKNISNGTEINMENLENGDQIIIDNFNHMMSATDIDDKEIIINDKKINHNWLVFWTNVNQLELNGDAEIQFLWQGIKII